MSERSGDTNGHASGGGDSAVLGTAADLVGRLTRVALRMSALPALAVQYLPKNAVFDATRGVVRAASAFPRAVGKAILEVTDEIGGPGDGGAAPSDPGLPYVRALRRNRTATAILFIHGFGMSSENTWGRFPRFVADDDALADWDVFTVGYSTSLWLDLAGLWAASPPISRLATYLETVASHEPFDGYESLAIVAHSMGGLVVQRALLESPELASRVGHVILFGTPSNGLAKASLVKFWKRQIQDMAADGPFIADLRKRWTERFGGGSPFRFLAVAGDEDEFVPSSSSLEPFPKRVQAVIPGNHVTVVQPKSEGALNVQIVGKQLLGKAAPTGPWNSARVAVEARQFQRAIDELWPARAELDDSTLVLLALALDSVGRREDAIAVLQESRQKTTDAMGTLAGRLKRRWLQEGRLEDGRKAQELYGLALARAEAGGDAAQSFYLAINVAFMELALDKAPKRAKETARRTLAHCAKAPKDLWRLATEGEAHLLLGEGDASIESYRQALGKKPEPWQIASMFHQAIAVAGFLDDEETSKRLRSLFRGEAKEVAASPPARAAEPSWRLALFR